MLRRCGAVRTPSPGVPARALLSSAVAAGIRLAQIRTMRHIPRRLLLLLVPALLALAQDRAQAPIVRSIRCEHFKKVKVRQILERFNERELRLAVEQPYHPEDLEAAKKVLADLLAEHGDRKARIQVEVRPLEPAGRAVEVVFSQL